jgi:hypothetical protein
MDQQVRAGIDNLAGILGGVGWLFITYVSGQHINPVFERQEFQSIFDC